MPNKFTTQGAMLKYSIQSGLFWIAWCPIAYVSTFLLGRDMSATMVGLSLAVGNLLALAIQPAIASTADGSGKLDIRTMQLGLGVAATASFAACLLSHSMVVMFLGCAFGYMFAQNMIALSNSISVYYINRGAQINYGVARGIGSLTWSITSFFLGRAIAGFGSDVIMIIGLVANVAMTLGFTILPTPTDVPPIVEESAEAQADEREVAAESSYADFLRDHVDFLKVIVGFSMCFVMGNIIMSYATLIIDRVGGTAENMGLALAISAMSELPAMWGMEALSKRIEPSKIMLFAAVGYVIKHAVIMLATSMGMLYVGYGLQMISYAVYTPCSVYFCNRYFGEGDKNKAVGLMVMVNPISAIIGNLFGGILVDSLGIFASLVFGTALTVAGAVIAFSGLTGTKAAPRAD